MTERATQWQLAEQWVAPAIAQAGITSGDKYYAWMRTSDQYVTREVARAVWKEHGVSTQWNDVIAKLPANQPIPRAWYSSSESEYIEKYGYKTTITYTDPVTEETLDRSWFVRSDKSLTTSQLDQAIRVDSVELYPELIAVVQSWSRVASYHREGASW